MPGSTTAIAVRAVRRVEDAESLPTTAVVVVLDVLRATTTMAFALAAGATEIIPALSVADAERLHAQYANSVLAGERHGVPPPGFDHGNSPRSMTSAAVGGRVVVMTTTNGTRALVAARRCRRVLTGALVSASAVAEVLRDDPGPLVMLCAGADGQPGVEDELGAGALLAMLAQHRAIDGDDAAMAMLRLWQEVGVEGCRARLHNAPAGLALRRIGLGDDVDDAARLDSCAVVGQLRRSSANAGFSLRRADAPG